MIYRFRVILDVKEDIFRDIEIDENSTLEELHEIIVKSFSMDGKQMASFYLSDEQWNQGEEISLFDLSEDHEKRRTMNQVRLNEVFLNKHDRMLYAYDFMNIKTFYVELFDIKQPDSGAVYPLIAYSYGDSVNYLADEFEEIEDPEAMDFNEEDFEDGFMNEDIFSEDEEFGSMNGYSDMSDPYDEDPWN